MNSSSIDVAVSPLAVAVIGCGRMGKLHARTYSQAPFARLVGVYDAFPQSAAATAAEFGCRAFDDLDALLSQVDAVTIATPTQFHATVAEACLKRGVACLIEKPLAAASAECLRIVEWARQYGVTVQVGHIERFNPAMRAVQKLNLRPRFIEAIRISPLTFRSLDVGVVLDMMIHDIDLVLNLAGSPVDRIDATGVGLSSGTEDICNARITFQNGCVANVTASRLALKTERKLRLFCADAFASIDFGKRTASIVRAGSNLPALRQAVANVKAGAITDLSQLKYTDMVQLEPLVIDEIDPLRAQAEAFITSVRTKRPPQVSAEDGWAAVLVAEQIVAAIRPESLQP